MHGTPRLAASHLTWREGEWETGRFWGRMAVPFARGMSGGMISDCAHAMPLARTCTHFAGPGCALAVVGSAHVAGCQLGRVSVWPYRRKLGWPGVWSLGSAVAAAAADEGLLAVSIGDGQRWRLAVWESTGGGVRMFCLGRASSSRRGTGASPTGRCSLALSRVASAGALLHRCTQLSPAGRREWCCCCCVCVCGAMRSACCNGASDDGRSRVGRDAAGACLCVAESSPVTCVLARIAQLW